MNKKLEHIKEMLRSAPKKGRKILYIGLTFLVVSITIFLFLRENGNYSCRISLKQKEFLNQLTSNALRVIAFAYKIIIY